MFAIACVHRTGGGTTAIGKTIEDAKNNADKLMAMPHLKGSYIFCTLPFLAFHDGRVGFDTAIPDEWKSDIKEIADLYSNQ
jgi:hypothetical protein